MTGLSFKTGIFHSALFRGAKAYRLQLPQEGDSATFLDRMRGVKRASVASLESHHFGQNPATNAAVVAGVEMRSTLAMTVVMQVAGKSLSHSHQLKRHMVDSSHSLCFR